MNIVLYLTNKIKYKWPKEYVDEFVGKLTKKGHDTKVISDDTETALVSNVLGNCDVFIGVKNQFDSLPLSGRRITIRAASEEGEGPLSTMQCAGCVEKLPERIDCLWADELCMKEVTPNDVLRHL